MSWASFRPAGHRNTKRAQETGADGYWIRAMLFTAAMSYVATCGALWERQGHFIFEPSETLQNSPGDYPFAIEDVAIPIAGTHDAHEMLDGWWIPSSTGSTRTVLYLHGNEGNISTYVDRLDGLRKLGYSVFVIDYRGYGHSGGGFPTEKGVYEDAQAAWNYLVGTRRIAPSNVLIYGHSLGGAIAIELATHHPEALGLVVESSFTSISDMASLDRRYAILPVSLLLDQRFDSIGKVGSLGLPVLYVHGTQDEVVPFDMGRRLFAATRSAVGFVSVAEGGHDDNALKGGSRLLAAIDDFVGLAPPGGRVASGPESNP